MISRREFRDLSPVIRHGRGDGRVSAILGASLTSVPNLDQLTAVASEAAMPQGRTCSRRPPARRFAATPSSPPS
jgi:phage I-like protein